MHAVDASPHVNKASPSVDLQRSQQVSFSRRPEVRVTEACVDCVDALAGNRLAPLQVFFRASAESALASTWRAAVTFIRG